VKVLHIITGLHVGGAEGALFRLVTEMKSLTHEVVSLTSGGEYGSRLRQAGISVYELDMQFGAGDVRRALRLAGLIRKSQPDAIQTWMYHADLIGGIVGRASGCRNLFWGIRNSRPGPDTLSRSTRLVVKACALLSPFIPKLIVSNSRQAAADHIAAGYDPAKTVVIPNGYSLTKLKPDLPARNSLRSEWRVEENEILFGMVARNDPIKDHPGLLEALALLHQSSSLKWKCVLVGPGMDSSNLALLRVLDDRKLAGRVSMVGPRPDVGEVMNAIDIHVLSSRAEAFPNVLCEAMACGTPCVSTDVGDAGLILGNTGWIVPPRDPGALARALEEACEEISSDSWAARKRLARDRVLKMFSIGSMAEKYQNLWFFPEKSPFNTFGLHQTVGGGVTS
jgi:glycosyltransferase involved in cell wall biosynthesis